MTKRLPMRAGQIVSERANLRVNLASACANTHYGCSSLRLRRKTNHGAYAPWRRAQAEARA